ncbi:hypothetical protein KSP40_PGU005118 [Platanthera guangdongensis]|uniref:Uncharacterized protein n=1 Tax=Platanthera guangdongensis TaxID=2320717 RepID=A0ABR2MIP7_9ASPA
MTDDLCLAGNLALQFGWLPHCGWPWQASSNLAIPWPPQGVLPIQTCAHVLRLFCDNYDTRLARLKVYYCRIKGFCSSLPELNKSRFHAFHVFRPPGLHCWCFLLYLEEDNQNVQSLHNI